MDSNNDNTIGRIDEKEESKVTVVLGALWGDEGKGKVVDMLAVDADVVCRCQGGSNADHNVVVDGIEYNFHLLPVGIIHPNCISVIGNGVIVHLPGLFVELQKNIAKGLTNWEGRLVISDRSHLVFDFHQQVDGYQEQEGQFIGTTKRGIGPTYSSKVTRNGITVGELLGDFSRFSEKFRILVAMYQRLFPNLVVNIDEELAKYAEYAKTIRPYVDNTVYLLDDCIKQGKKVIVEAANAAMLDIDFGTYPYVTSSNSSVGGVCTGLGIPPTKIGEVIGVFKSYVSRVGEGPFPTELNDEIGKLLQKRGREIGVTTGRTRRCGWLDLFLVKYTHVINGYTAVCLTKLDILDTLPEVKLGIGYTLHGEKLNRFPSSTSDLACVEVQYLTLPGWLTSTENVKVFADLPENAQKYIKTIQEFLEVPIKWVATGRSRESIIKMF